jgi:hypothetical protein
MVVRERIISPPPAKPVIPWPWHKVQWTGVRARQLLSGERRLEADTYLSSGYGIRLAIQSRPAGWARLEEVAFVTQPSRLKGVLVPPEHGTPFLAATQVFDFRPVPRKWLAMSKTKGAEDCFVNEGTILVTRSGNVGQSIIAFKPHADIVVSDDLLRVKARRGDRHGWLYAFLQSAQARAMATGAHYGQIIKHLEVSHLNDLPVPLVDDRTAAGFAERVSQIIRLRDEAHRMTLAAEALFEQSLGSIVPDDSGETGFAVRCSLLAGTRRRLDAAAHNPAAVSVRQHLKANGKGFTTIAGAGYDVWLPTRFRRIPATEGVWLWDSSAITEVNPRPARRIADIDFGDPFRGRVKSGWVLMARSGQVYGILGTPVLASAAMEGHVVSDDVMRIRPLPGASIRAGYLITAMSHPTLGRPLVKALAYGSSVPHLDVGDVKGFEVVRLGAATESKVADLAEAAAKARGDADLIEQAMGREAGEFIEEFMHRPAVRLVSGGDAPAETNGDAAHEFEALAERWESERPRGGNVAAMSRVPSYQAVIAMGTRAVAPILKRIHFEPDHWFVALHRITGENPVPPEAEGKLRAMADAWVKWGRERGIIGELD